MFDLSVAWIQEVVQTQPEAPAVMIKDQRHDYRQHDQDSQYRLTDRPRDQAVYQERAEQKRFGSDNIDVDRSDKIALLALINQTAIVAMGVHPKQRSVEPSHSTLRTPELQSAYNDSSCSAGIQQITSSPRETFSRA